MPLALRSLTLTKDEAILVLEALDRMLSKRTLTVEAEELIDGLKVRLDETIAKFPKEV
jgi:hypothetical protein